MSYTDIFLEQLYEFTDKTGQSPETIYMSYEMFNKILQEYRLSVCLSTHGENITNEILGYKVEFAEFEEGKTKVVFSIV